MAKAADSACPDADTNVIEVALRDFEHSVLCVMNERRVEYGLTPLRSNGLLHREVGVSAVHGLTNGFPSTEGVTVAAELGFRQKRKVSRSRGG